MLTRWVSVKDDQGRASNSRSILLIWVAVSPIRLAVAGHLRNVDGGSVAVGAVVVSQGVGYCEYQGVASVNLFLDRTSF